ncbi:discoidin domain-containing protein [Saccharopolyspora sp. K220]|uniref:discoidin domain-containing protein n=1 Tax=Saccharopolyspora soli TaxID=2926618 RepID=UPI001F5795F9|nr:discoidin domain-containing protein [Saccharopolyspora soli]MCI2416890.1 discoidin domain-containing protein [Saccharopolyspora soli]
MPRKAQRYSMGVIARIRRHARLFGLIAVLAVVSVAQPIYALAQGDRNGDATVSVATDPARLDIQTGQCDGGSFTVKLTNTSRDAVYADATLSAPPELQLQRTTISTYLPAGYTRDVVIPVTSPLGTATGTYPVTVASGRSTATLPVSVTASSPDASGNLALSATKVSASSTHQSFRVCGAVDGDADSEHWSTSTGWNDGNSKVWPDWYEVRWDTPQTIGRADLYTLNSTRYPAATNGLKDWDVQVLSGTEWQTVASVRGNAEGLVSSTFTPVQTTAVRFLLLAGNGANDYSRIVELGAFAA